MIGREQLELVRDGYLRPTPAGAFRAVSGATPDAVSTFLHAILRQPSMPWLDLGTVVALTGVADPQGALAVLHAAQEDGLVEALDEPQELPAGSLEEVVPQLLVELSLDGTIVLADADGLPVWFHGMSFDLAERLAALSADLATVHARHRETLGALDTRDGGAFALVDGLGASQLGCWPLHVGQTRFVLVAQGLPRLHHPHFTTLVWLLVRRYG